MAVAEYTGEIVMSAVNNVGGDLGFTEELVSTTPEASSSFLGRFRILLPNLFGHSRLEAIQSFDFLSYVNEASELSSDFAMAVAEYTGEIVMSAINNAGGDLGVSLSQNFHPILLSNANKLVSTLLDRFEISVPTSPRELVLITPEASSPQNEATSALWSKGLVMKGGSLAWKSNVDIFGADVGFNDEGRGGSAMYKRVVASFEEEPVESLQQQEIAFKLIGHILDKIWKRDWAEQGQLLKVRINTELSVYQAAAGLQIKSLSSFDLNGKSLKRLLHGILALLIEAAEACLFCVWQKLSICDELFSSLLVDFLNCSHSMWSAAACLAHSLQTPCDKYCARRLGADFLGPLLLVVAEICSDFDPTVDVEPALLKLFRNLWFYVTLFGLAPPIRKTLYMVKLKRILFCCFGFFRGRKKSQLSN
ncbi:unnamed protein product [Ilex paraguariensis]|uniref:PI4-kinase N-terminal domain-containing protein n=1 Tax=Ilex paraguariensis TaxID=185542 RepID=A0ABC8U136_9AQUA